MDNPAEYLSHEPTPAKKPPAISQGEAALRGTETGFTQRFAPVVHGVEEAGYEAMPDWAKNVFGRDQELFAQRAPQHLAKMVTGLSRLGYEHLMPALGFPVPQYGTEAYERGRQRSVERQEAAEAQWPKTYLGGELGGALAGPKYGMLKGGSPWARVGWSALGGGAAGATTEVGKGVSEEKPIGETAAEASKGALTGAGLGVVGGGVLEGGRKAVQIGRGLLAPEREAAVRVAESMVSDIEQRGTAISPQEAAVADIAGTPLTTMDWAHEGTRRLARWASNQSPEAANEIAQVVIPRYEQQAARVSGFIDRMFGGLDRGAEREGIEQAARNANGPAYRRAYAVGANDLTGQSQRIQDLMQIDEVQAAMKAAEKKWRSRATLDGFGGNFPTEKNLQYWDYVHRELADDARAFARNGRNEDASRIGGLDRMLKDELDTLVPQFAQARRGAYGFFNSENALDAGVDFARNNSVDRMQGAARALSQMSQGDRELFARGFASELISKLRDPAVSANVVNKAFVDSPNAQAALNLALGSTRARQVEALIRVEKIADGARRAMGNSTTMQQFLDTARQSGLLRAGAHGIGGMGAVALLEGIEQGHIDPYHVIVGGILMAVARAGVHQINERTATKVAELLTSQDPGELSRGLQIVSSSRPIFQALRTLTGAGGRTAESELGPERTGAGLLTALTHLISGPGGEPHHGAQHQDKQQDIISEHLPQ
jgi:hypothetical protein